MRKILFMLTSQRWSVRPAWSSSSLEQRWIAWCCCTESSRLGPPDPERIVRPGGRFRTSRNCCSIWLRAGKRSVGGTCKIWWGRGCARSIRRWNGRLTNWEIGTGRVARLKARGKPIYLMLIGLSGSSSPFHFPNWTSNGVKRNSSFAFKTYLEYGLLRFLIVPSLVRSFVRSPLSFLSGFARTVRLSPAGVCSIREGERRRSRVIDSTFESLV